MKFGDNSIDGKSGLEKHLIDIETFCEKEENVSLLKETVINTFSQLRTLGLINFGNSNNKNEILELSKEKPEFILLLSNHKPTNNQLYNSIINSTDLNNVDVKVAKASYMGYGLYAENMIPLNEFKKNE